MLNMTKLFKPALALTLIAAVAVGGTLAYLQDKTEEVKNSFTFCDDDAIDIDLFEETFGDPGNTDAVPMIPGSEIDKDPQITVSSGNCYLYVDVVETCSVTNFAFPDFIDYQINAKWTKLTVSSNPTGTTTYVYTNGTGTPVAVDDSITDLYLLVDNKVTVKPSATQEMLTAAQTNNPSLTFTGYALQAENVDASAANTQFIATFK